MRVDFFTIPALDPESSTGDLNKLLASARILTVDRQFVADGSRSFCYDIHLMAKLGSISIVLIPDLPQMPEM